MCSLSKTVISRIQCERRNTGFTRRVFCFSRFLERRHKFVHRFSFFQFCSLY
nr:MAG TPA: hypothetical protein [Caudoviricetes sp.]